MILCPGTDPAFNKAFQRTIVIFERITNSLEILINSLRVGSMSNSVSLLIILNRSRTSFMVNLLSTLEASFPFKKAAAMLMSYY